MLGDIYKAIIKQYKNGFDLIGKEIYSVRKCKYEKPRGKSAWKLKGYTGKTAISGEEFSWDRDAFCVLADSYYEKYNEN